MAARAIDRVSADAASLAARSLEIDEAFSSHVVVKVTTSDILAAREDQRDKVEMVMIAIQAHIVIQLRHVPHGVLLLDNSCFMTWLTQSSNYQAGIDVASEI